MSHVLNLKSESLPAVRGRYTENAPLGAGGWFRTGGAAEILFKPADREDLAEFLAACPDDIEVRAFGVLSNTIIRDGGLPGVTIRLGRDFAAIEPRDNHQIYAGSLALDANVANNSAKAGIAGLEFYSGIPGTIGGALRMNAGAYGTETKDVLIHAEAIDRRGKFHQLTPSDMGMRYRHSDAPPDMIFLGGLFQGHADDPAAIEARIADIKTRRADTQPIKEKTGGSTFANPDPADLEKAGLPLDTKCWQLIDKAGCRGLSIGGAMMSEKHCNFMINTGGASATDLEALGEEVRRRVYETSGIMLRWEIRRIGEPLGEHKI